VAAGDSRGTLVTAVFTKGLIEIGDALHAYLQPDGSWGWSNSGVAIGSGSSLLVDTLFDLRLTAEMLDSMAPLTAASPIKSLVNTHANGDHCYGNQLVAGPDVAVYASQAAADEMDETPPTRLSALVRNAPAGITRDFVVHAFGPFDFGGIDVPAPTHTFNGRHEIEVGGRRAQLIEVGPAHTAGDVLVWIPDDEVLFAGDILFIGGTPIMWAGPIENWIAACDLIAELNPSTVVPGHGPLTAADGAREMGAYLRLVDAGTRARHAAGMSPREASLDLDTEINGTRFGTWGDRERLVVTVHTIWRELDAGAPAPGLDQMIGWMAEDFGRHGG
jgi:cyclase